MNFIYCAVSNAFFDVIVHFLETIHEAIIHSLFRFVKLIWILFVRPKRSNIFLVFMLSFFSFLFGHFRYRISLFSQWKQRGMYAACMWIVQFLLVVSKLDSVFLYIPEFYLETLVHRFFLFLFELRVFKIAF